MYGRRAVFHHVAGDQLGFGLRQIERRAVGFRERRDEEHDEHREQRQPEPAEQAASRLFCASTIVAQIERAGAQQHGDDDEADRDLVGHHLRGRAQRAEERIFRVRRPAAHDDAVDAERGDREDVEDADIDVGDHPAGADRDHRPGGEREHAGDQRREQEHALVGARRDHRLLEHELQQVGEGLQQAPGADHVRARAAICTAAQILRSASST